MCDKRKREERLRKSYAFILAFLIVFFGCCQTVFASVREITFFGVPWLSLKADVFEALHFHDLSESGKNPPDNWPVYALGKVSQRNLGEHTNRKIYKGKFYGTAPIGTYTYNLEGGEFKASGFFMYFCCPCVDGQVIEDEERAKLVSGIIQIKSDDYINEYDRLVEYYTDVYGEPDKQEVLDNSDIRHRAYTYWYGENGGYAQIVLDTPQDNYNNLVLEFGTYEIESIFAPMGEW